MERNYKRLQYIVLLFSAGIVVLDQILKLLARQYLSVLPDRTLPIIPNVLHLSYVENRGAAFGMLDGKGIFLIVLTGVIIVAAICLLLLGKFKSRFFMWSAGLIIGGGIGNLVDRLVRHYVIDYIDVRLIHFAVFNLADCCVVVGTILVMIYVIFFESKSASKGNGNG